MNLTDEHQLWVEKIIQGDSSLHALPESWPEAERAAVRWRAIEQILGSDLESSIEADQVLEAAQGRNGENLVGMVGVPLGIVGPVRLEEEQPFFIPLAMTEGALVASVQRGVKALQQSEQLAFLIEDRGMTRAPVFVVTSIAEAVRIREWLDQPETFEALQKLAATTSSHLRLEKVMHRLVGKNLFVKFFFDTQAAMGMNMATIASQRLVNFIEETLAISCIALSGNGCVDKKPSWGTVMDGRGMYVQVEAVIPDEVLQSTLKTEAAKIAEVVYRKNFVGGASYGSMGFNAHFANMVAAFYLATGQDAAHVVEGSVGITTAEPVEGGLYFSVTIPNVLMGVIGGGTQLPYQRRSLAMMRIDGSGLDDKRRLGRNLGYTVLAGELSLLAALSSGSLARAHQTLGRRHG